MQPVQPWRMDEHASYLGARRPLVRVLLIAMSRGNLRAARALVKTGRLFRVLMQFVLADDPCQDALSQWY